MPFHAPTATGLMLRLWCTQGFTPCTSQRFHDWSWVRLGTWDSYLKHTTSPLAVTSPSLGSLGWRKIPRPFENNPFEKPFASFHWSLLLGQQWKHTYESYESYSMMYWTKTQRIWQVTCLSWNNLKYTKGTSWYMMLSSRATTKPQYQPSLLLQLSLNSWRILNQIVLCTEIRCVLWPNKAPCGYELCL